METTALLESGLVRSHMAADVAEEKAIKEKAGSAQSTGSRGSPRSRDPKLCQSIGTPRLDDMRGQSPKEGSSDKPFLSSTPRQNSFGAPSPPPPSGPNCFQRSAPLAY